MFRICLYLVYELIIYNLYLFKIDDILFFIVILGNMIVIV